MALNALERRILAVAPDKWRKSSRVADEAMGKKNPPPTAIEGVGEERWNALIAHYADAYAAIVGLVQPWRRRYPLLAGNGNFGTPHGDEPADVFFTEVRISDAGRAVRDGDPYDLLDEPLPHRWSELAAAVAVARRPSATIDDVLEVMPGPDFPVGDLVDAGEVRRLYVAGRGRLTLRAPVSVEDGCVVVREGLYGVSLDDLTRRLCALPDLAEAFDDGAREWRFRLFPRPGALDRVVAAARARATHVLDIDLGAPLLERLRALPLREDRVIADARRTTVIRPSS